MVQKVNFNNLTGDTLTVGNTTINGTGVTVDGAPLSGGSGGATQYANTASLPKQNLTFGEFALVGNTLFITNGVGWYSVALINQSPSLSISVSDISLGATGNTINFTYTATDPDGPEPTVTLETTANTSQANVTLYTSNSTVTVENLSATDYSANITLTATDGIDQTFGTVTLNVSYLSELWDETVLSIGTSSTDGLDNSTFVDRSTNAHTVTSSGSPVQTAFHPYLDNWSVEFDGTSSSYVGLSSYSSTPLYNNNGDLTIECWVYSRTTSVLGIFDGSPLVYDGIRNFPANTIEIVKAGGGPSCSFSIPTFKWVHFATVIDNSNISVYVDGVLADTTTYSDYALANDFDIGVVNEGGAGKFDGYISNFRITTEKLYTSNFTPLTTELTQLSNTTFLGLKNNRFISSDTVYGGTLTPSGTPKISAFNPFGQDSEYAVGENKGSVFSSGDSSYLNVSGGSWLTLDGDFDISFWYYSIDLTTERNILISTYHSDTAGWVLQTTTTGEISLAFTGDGSDLTTTSCLVAHNWHHIRFSRNSGVVKVHVDGVEVGSVSNSGTFTYSNTLVIGNLGANRSPYNNIDGQEGYISDLVFKQSAPVSYNVPTEPVGNTNASLYLPFDNAGIFDKTGNHTLTLVGDTSTSTTQTKYADTSLELVSTTNATDYLVIPSSDLPSFGTNDFTIEFWLYPNSTTTNWATSSLATILDTDVSAGTGADWWAIHQNNATIQFATDDADLITTSSSLTASTWQHVAIVRSGSTITAYIDGTSVGTATKGTTIGGTRPIYIGQQNGQSRWFKGYLENIQILKGVAKYTANFTVPNRTQGLTYQAES